MGSGPGSQRVDFFISHAGVDGPWAEWVAWQLTAVGYTVELDLWDWAAGENFVTKMDDALGRCAKLIGLVSHAYLDRSRHTTQEWTAIVATAEDGRLVPVRVEDVPSEAIPLILRPLLSCDLVGLDAAQARRVLLAAVGQPRRPDGEPAFPGGGPAHSSHPPGGSAPRLPGRLPELSNVPGRNRVFTGRDRPLAEIRERASSGGLGAVQALHGISGAGKTQLAIEYAHRFAGAYDLIWWIDSEQISLIGDQFTVLANALRCGPAAASAEETRQAVLHQLRERDRWLLIFDNAEDLVSVKPWLPSGDGHVLIVSRGPRQVEIAMPFEVGVLARAESVAMLCDRVSDLSPADAGLLADQLGDLPLAVAQAAGFMERTAASAEDYLEVLSERPARLLDLPLPDPLARPLTTTTNLAMDSLRQADPAAEMLAALCAFLAPDPIPEYLFTGAPGQLPDLLAGLVTDRLSWREALGRLMAHALVRIDKRGLQMHRLTQAIVRARLTAGQAARARERVDAILAAGRPGDPADPSTWARWAQLMPHLLSARPGGTPNPDLRATTSDACQYLLAHGETRSGYELVRGLYREWRSALGDDDPHTLTIASHLAKYLYAQGDLAEARELDEDTLRRRQRVLPPDDPAALTSASNLAADLAGLGDLSEATKLDRETLARRRQTLGEDHPDTLASVHNLANDLSQGGQLQEARELLERTLRLLRRRSGLGWDHPDTLACASSLATTLAQLPELAAARELAEDTLTRRRRVLGLDHRSTLATANNLAGILRDQGETAAARDLGRDTYERLEQTLGRGHPYSQACRSILDDLDAME
jgi:tetratricopeptide (TPR) repeat protein